MQSAECQNGRAIKPNCLSYARCIYCTLANRAKSRKAAASCEEQQQQRQIKVLHSHFSESNQHFLFFNSALRVFHRHTHTLTHDQLLNLLQPTAYTSTLSIPFNTVRRASIEPPTIVFCLGDASTLLPREQPSPRHASISAAFPRRETKFHLVVVLPIHIRRRCYPS